MRMLTFSTRCTKEIIRDPLNVFFGLGFPAVLLLLLSAMQKNIPVALFEIESLAPGIAVFGLSFMTLFSATLIARDRESAFLARLYTTPLSPWDFILGYTLPMLPVALAQTVFCYLLALLIGFPLRINVVYAVLAIIPIAFLYVSLGLLFGSIFNVKQVGGICGALLTNLSAWLSGIWFDIALVGGTFSKIANLLPFVHAVEIERGIITGDHSGLLINIAVVTCYGAVAYIGAAFAFFRQMKRQ